jgi:hypothetical protein
MKTLSPEVKRLAALIYSAIGTPHSSKLLAALESGDWDSIATSQVDPRAYTDSREYFLDAQASALLKKYKGLPCSFNRRGKALANWKAGEDSCFKANERLAPYLEGFSHPSCDVRVSHHIDGIRKIVKSILGKAPSLDDLNGNHGPGATFSDPSVRSTIADKMNSVPSMTPSAFWFLLPWMQTKWGDACRHSSPQRNPAQVRGNRFMTAPKDATKDRPIAAEPSINIFYQLSLGKLIRQRLNTVGIDLSGGQDVHRQVACESSITGFLSTLDLSNASDTVAYNLVKLLLPPEWFALLDQLRSPFTRMSRKDAALLGRSSENKEVWVKLEKFSSMGNGFTFELESLLFYAIVRYTEMYNLDGMVESKVLVYGDDIICPTEIVRPVIAILNFFGFSINETKSFFDSPFRESCGGDYFSGQAVRPYYLKKEPCAPHHFIAAANALRAKVSDSLGDLDIFKRAWFHLLDQIPSDIRSIRGPRGLGDLVIHDEQDRWVIRWRTQSYYQRVYRPHRTQKVPYGLFDADVVHACALYGAPSGPGLTPRDPVQSFKKGWIVAYGRSEVSDFIRPVRRNRISWERDIRFELIPRSVRYRVARPLGTLV